MEGAGVCASAGSSCSSGAAEGSHVVAACGVAPELAAGAVRLQQRAGAAAAGGALRVLCSVYFCRDNDVCLFQEVVFEVALGGEEGAGAVEMAFALSPRAPAAALPRA
jgi:hypothetical protein